MMPRSPLLSSVIFADEESSSMMAYRPPFVPPPVDQGFGWSDIPLQGEDKYHVSSAACEEGNSSSSSVRHDEGEQVVSIMMMTTISSSNTTTDQTSNSYEMKDDESLDDSIFESSSRKQRFFPTSPVSSMDYYGLLSWDDERTVSFATTVTVRLFTVTVGDHPACELPMQLGDLQDSLELPLQLEKTKRQRPVPLSYEERLLVIQASTGYSEEALRRMEYEILTQQQQ